MAGSLARSLVAQHEPTKGKLREVYISRRYKGQQELPVDQVLHIAGGYQGTLTVTTAAAGDYITKIGKTVVRVVAGAGDTVAQIRDKIFAAVNKEVATTGVYAASKATGTFKLVGSALFTATVVGTNHSVGAIALVSGGGATKGDDTLNLLEPLKGRMEAGQYLCFADDNDIEVVALLRETALVGATTLSIYALTQAIVGGGRAEFPPYLWDRTSADIDRSFANSTFSTFNTGGDRDGTATTKEKNLSVPGVYNPKNAAYLTAKRAAEDGVYIHARVVDPPLDESGDFEKFVVVEGRALVTAVSSPAPQDGFIGGDLSIAFMGAVTEGDPYAND
jgi:hypothetical protein